jgi:hypothetical protein
MIITYQVLARTNEYLEKGKVKEILYNLIDAVNGIPLVNRDNIIIIKWDEIFKKLIDKKEYHLYDSIVKTKTKTIDQYVNKYPSLLFDSSMDMVERNSKIDTHSVIPGRRDNGIKENDQLGISNELFNKLSIKYLSSDKITFSNIDSSIYIDVLLNDEYEPADFDKFGGKPDSRFDGFSIIAFHKENKHVIVPRTMVFGKRIDKEKWLYRNIDKIMQCAENIAAGLPELEIVIDELSLQPVLSDYIDENSSKIPAFHFECIEDNLLIFSGMGNGKELGRAYCALDTNHNGFEIKLIRYELVVDDKVEVVEEEKTIAIGNAYQPLLAVMEKMQIITDNIKKAISKKDIDTIVIK